MTDCTANLGLTQTFIQGYMNGSTMQPVLLNCGVAGATASQCDTITVALHAPSSPFAQVFATKTILSTTGTATAVFPPSTVSNNYYETLHFHNIINFLLNAVNCFWANLFRLYCSRANVCKSRAIFNIQWFFARIF